MDLLCIIFIIVLSIGYNALRLKIDELKNDHHLAEVKTKLEKLEKKEAIKNV